jgi:hypothetical protein
MPRIGISITKSTPFRNSVQEFSNVYYYEITGTLPAQPQAEALIDELVAFEKTVHSTGVTFLRGRCWSAGGTQAQNNMIAQKNLSGTGATAVDAALDRERAFLFRIRAGVDIRGNPVYLRKWYHSCGQFAGSGVISASVTANNTGFSAGVKATMENNMNTIKFVGGVGGWRLCAKNGRTWDEDHNFQSHNFLEHHQFGDMWRAA